MYKTMVLHGGPFNGYEFSVPDIDPFLYEVSRIAQVSSYSAISHLEDLVHAHFVGGS